MPRLLAVSPCDGPMAKRYAYIGLSMYKGADLSRCTQTSILLSFHSIMRSGLNPDRVFKECWVIPRRIKGVWTACFQVGYAGMMRLGRNGDISGIRADNIFSGDHFEFTGGMNVVLDHRPAWLENKEQGDRVGAYVVWHDERANKQAVPISLAQLDKRRQVSKKSDNGMWRDWEDEMYLKTALIYASRFWPKITEMAAAIEGDALGVSEDPVTPDGVAMLRADAIEVEDLPTETEKLNEEMTAGAEAHPRRDQSTGPRASAPTD